MQVLILLPILFAQITCSGFLRIRLKSQHDQEAKLIVGTQGNPEYIVSRISLHSRDTRKLGPFPIEFEDKYNLVINGGKVEKLGINGSTYKSDFAPIRGTLSPKQLHLPLNGLELIFECDEGWTGSKCDISCSEDCDSSRANREMTVSTDYSIDLTKLPEIVERLKKTTIVDNEIREEPKKDPKKEKENPNKIPSIFGLFSDLLGSYGKPRHESKHRSLFDSEPQAPYTFMRRFSAQKRAEDEEKKIEQHSSTQKSFGLRHQKPTRFSHLDGPTKSMDMLSIMGPLMGLMPQISVRESIGSEEFALDQIFKD